ncbi:MULTISPECIES: hypothetical protein [unclassified Pseudoclavibacter]|uniref:hypothetical protein n=1 Tax=unclassified Pseudoclavibacter TaxID=2615177 RepID=UPI0012F45A69|nr:MULTISPECIES: hypothetical protein [unclassified Pseudoclavibacter]MBF4460155.1 hypothetical protein [Pseudoclavibacter sp. VKM Ac-2867]VXC15484.1 conserved exported hypothetical protein [Pseudoclavibacter sp. 8L]
MDSQQRGSRFRWKAAGLGAACAVAVVLSGCSPTGQAPSSESSTGTFSPAAAPQAAESSDASESSAAPDGGELVFAATADDRHSWITAEARVTGVTRTGTCEYTASAEGVDTITRTAKALSSNYDTVCGDISFELGTPGTYTVTVTITGVTAEPVTGSTEVEFLGSSAD